MALTWNDIKEQLITTAANDPKMAGIIEKMNAGSVTWDEANEYGIRAGQILSDIFKQKRPGLNISEWDIEDLIPKSLGMDYRMVSEVAQAAQTTMNAADGIGIKAQASKFDSDSAYGIVEELKANPDYTNIENTFYDQIINFSQSVVDETIQANAEFQSKSGIKCYVVRKPEWGACKWCQALAGSYDYEDVKDTGNDVWRRHENCRCTINYVHEGSSDLVNNYKKIGGTNTTSKRLTTTSTKTSGYNNMLSAVQNVWDELPDDFKNGTWSADELSEGELKAAYSYIQKTKAMRK